jgi:type II secretion system protein H
MRSRGFTLIELVLVLLIVSVVIGVAAPSLSTFIATHKVTNAANQIVALARHGRAQAIAEGRSYRLNVDATNGTYWLEVQDGAAFKKLGTDNGQRYTLPDGTRATWSGDVGVGAQFVQFFPDGRSDAGGLVLENNTNRRIELGAPSESEMWRVMKDGQP